MKDEYSNDEFDIEEEYNSDYKQGLSQEIELKSDKKNNIFSRVLLFQVVVCMMLLASLGGLKIMAPEIYSKVNSQLQIALTGPEFKEGAKDILNKIMEFINGLTPIGKENSQNLSSEESSQVTSDRLQIDKSIEQQNENEAQSKSGTEQELNFTQPANGHISSPFGERVSPLDGNAGDFHYGVDIAVGDGTPVAAMADGVVGTTAFSKGSGNFLFITHANGYESLYAHCSEILVESGCNVVGGQIIALSGHTGLVTGPHLHFGVKKDGKWINPADLFPAFA